MDEKRLQDIFNRMIDTGCDFNNFPSLYNDILLLLRKDGDLLELYNEISKSFQTDTFEFLNSRNDYGTNYVSGLSSCIYLPDMNKNGEYNLTVFGGNRNRWSEDKINEDTLFDLASITKLFTLVLIFRLEKTGFLNLDDTIASVNPNYKFLEDFTFNDLIRLHGEICTEKRISTAKNQNEAWNMMHNAYLKSNSRTENKYTDMGAIIIADTICKIINDKTGKKMSYGEIMNEFLFKEIGINNSCFLPNSQNIAGNGHFDSLPHDPKARILGPTGHAGLFSNNNDICKLAKSIMRSDLLDKKQRDRLGEVTFPYSESSNIGNLGIFLKTPLGLSNSFTPREYSNGSFSHQGWTGGIATFDTNNYIHQSILVSSVVDNLQDVISKNDKPLNYFNAFKEYELKCIKNTLIVYIVREYYKRYLNKTNNYEKKIKL